MNKTLIWLVLLIFLILPSQFLMLKEPLYPSHDALFHIRRISEFHKAFIQKQIPPRLAPSILSGIGYPLFVVNYQLPYYLAEPVMQITSDPILAFKTILSTTFLLSSLFAFLLFKNFGSNLAALCASIIFTYLPYRFANLYTRGSFGESTSFMFVPLVLMAIHHVAKGRRLSIPFLAVSIFGLIISHTIVFLLFAPFFILYAIFFTKSSKKTLTLLVIGLTWGIALSSFQIIPALLEKKYLVFDQRLLDLYNGHFINIAQLLRIPKMGVNTGTPFQIGISATLVIVLSLILQITKPNLKRGFFLLFAIIAFFATTKFSVWFWQNLPLISYILYPWRFISLIVVSCAFLTVFLIDEIRFGKAFAVILITLTIYASRHYFAKPTQFEASQITPTLTTQNEYDTIWSNKETFKPRAIVTTSEPVQISNLSQDPFKISFLATPDKETKIIIRKMYFPGWQATVNGKNYPIQIQDGLINLDLEPGTSQIEVFFKESPLRKFADLITLISFAALIIFVIKLKIHKPQ